MKVLMFGWEFPPHILGGLGTASYGITAGLAKQPDMQITFCIPKPWGDEDKSFMNIIGLSETPIVWRDVDHVAYRKRVYRTMAWRHPLVKAGRSLEELFINLRHGQWSRIFGAVANRLRIASGKKEFK